MNSVRRAGFFSRRGALAALGFALVGACGHGPTQPDPPPVPSITLTCPTDITREDVTTPSQPVTYPVPTATGGVPPVTVTCSPSSGSSFGLGATAVNCDASDGQRRASCTFSVRLDPLPVLRSTRFMAFGDSITAGELQVNPVRTVVEPDKSYPTRLAQMLSARYRTQTITMFNEGVSGESAETGTARIGRALSADNPEVLLLMQGVLDLGNGPPRIPRIITVLKSDIDQARARGVRDIFLGTLLPQKQPLPGFQMNNDAMPWIEQANDEIRSLASREGVFLVDLYAAVAPNVDADIGGDGLHPTEQGFIVMAQTFFDSIKSNLELTPAARIRGLVNPRSSSRMR